MSVYILIDHTHPAVAELTACGHRRAGVLLIAFKFDGQKISPILLKEISTISLILSMQEVIYYYESDLKKSIRDCAIGSGEGC